jgi:hypothetical protein
MTKAQTASTGKVKRAARPAAAKRVAPRTAKPPLGGSTGGAVILTALQRAILRAASDEIIPPGEGFPAPSEVGVVEDFMPRYITPLGEEPRHFPFVAHEQFSTAVDALGQRFLDAGPEERVETLRAVERDDPIFFGQLRDLVYYGYYSRAAVTDAIRAHLPAGGDYHGAPQPYGYAGVIEDWDLSRLPRGRGRYIPTDRVRSIAVRPAGAAAVGAQTGA